MRSGVRQAYSRMVFEWKGKVTYELDQSTPGQVTITFSRGAQPDTKDVDLGALANIGAMNVLSTEPLKISFTIPEKSKTRAFTTADRVFLDVYNPPDGSKPFLAGAANEAAKPPVAPLAEATEEKKEPLPELKGKKAVAAPPAYVLTPEVVRPVTAKNVAATPPPEPAASPQVIEEAIKQQEHIISLSATSPFAMAIFENFGELWFVMDREGYSLRPSLSSADPELFGAFLPAQIEGGSAYHISRPKGLDAKTQGGGLVWRLILDEPAKIRPNKPVVPTRETGKSADMRSGKMIWPLQGVGDILHMPDPVTGQELIIVTVDDALQGTGKAMSFTDFDVLASYAGLVIRPKVDDLLVEKTAAGVQVSRPNGLAILPSGAATAKPEGEKPFFNPAQMKEVKVDGAASGGGVTKKSDKIVGSVEPTLFNFKEWEMGDAADLERNKTIILSTIKDKPDMGQIEDLMRLAKMYLAHGMGPEALGFLDLARQTQPQLGESSEFHAMRGVARAFTNKSEIALADLLDKNLSDFDEIKLWKSYVLADLGDWKQAADVLPDDVSVLYSYPDYIANRLALALAEVYLREGKKENAERLLAYVEQNSDNLDAASRAALEYLRGESYRQRGMLDKTIELWEGMKDNPDDLYRIKANLALTVLLKEKGDIKNAEAINRLEKLRYAWRGDQLEAQVNYWLGKFYFESRDFVKGLNILREAASIAVDSDLGKRIAIDMGDIFQNLFLDKSYSDVSAVDLVTVYEQFNELTPPGDKGNLLVQKLAERMFDADLLERAAALLRQQVAHRLTGEEKIRVAVRLAAIELLDKRPDQALTSLASAEKELAATPDSPSKAARQREIDLLKARAMAKSGDSSGGLRVLEGLPPSADVNRLKADIAWQNGYWSDASAALEDVLAEENISSTKPLSENQAALIMNRAIALSLAKDRVELANMRQKYSDLMLQSNKARQFEVITRPHGTAELADRETLQSMISEVDLFGDFLESYKKAE